VTGVLVSSGWIVLSCVDTLSVVAEDFARSPRRAGLCRTITPRPQTLALASIVTSRLLHALGVGAMVFEVWAVEARGARERCPPAGRNTKHARR